MPGVRVEDSNDACDVEEIPGQGELPSDGGGNDDDADIREALETEGEETGSSHHSPFVQVGTKKVRDFSLSCFFSQRNKHTN